MTAPRLVAESAKYIVFALRMPPVPQTDFAGPQFNKKLLQRQAGVLYKCRLQRLQSEFGAALVIDLSQSVSNDQKNVSGSAVNRGFRKLLLREHAQRRIEGGVFEDYVCNLAIVQDSRMPRRSENDPAAGAALQNSRSYKHRRELQREQRLVDQGQQLRGGTISQQMAVHRGF